MNQIEGVIKKIKSVDEISNVYVKSSNGMLSVLILDGEKLYKEGDIVNLFFKETEVMIATKNSLVSTKNSFISPIISIKKGEILAQIDFNFDSIKITSIITKEALEELGCCIGDNYLWFIKSNEISIEKVS